MERAISSIATLIYQGRKAELKVDPAFRISGDRKVLVIGIVGKQ
jgi:hypothetical protein